MGRQRLNLDKRYTGATEPRKHRVRWVVLALACMALAAASLAVVLVVARAGMRARSGFTGQGIAPLSLVRDPEAPAEPAPAPEPEDEPATQDPVTLDLMMIGDVLMHEAVIESGNHGDGTYSYEHLFSHIGAEVEAADVAVLNQETILGGSAWPYSGYPVFNSPQAVGDNEAALGFDVVLKATNHTLDLGYDGVRAELAYWHDKHPEMSVIGAADPDGNGVCPAGGTSPAGACLIDHDGLKVALLNYTDVLNGNVDPSFDHRVVSIMGEEGVRADVAAAREAGADFVVVFTHWGEEYETTPTERERYWAGVLHDAGVDVVIGGHPHVIQPVEVLGEGDDRMLVMWSVGNFVSNQPGAANMVGGMAKVHFVKDADGCRVGEWSFTPTVTQREGYSTNLTAYLLRDYTDELAAASSINATDPGNGGTAGWYRDYCASVLGDAFDWDTLSVHGSLS